MSIIHTFSKSISRIGLFWQEKVNGQLFRWNIFLILFQFALLFIKFNSLPPQIPLYYSQPWGETRLAPVSSIFLLPLFSILVAFLNNLLAIFFLKSQQLLSRLLIVFSLLFSFLITFTLFQITNLIS